MKTVTATRLQRDSLRVMQEANKEPITITHKFHGEFILMSMDEFKKSHKEPVIDKE